MTLSIAGAKSEAGEIDVVVEHGVITAAGPASAQAARSSRAASGSDDYIAIDGAGLLVIPGVIDPHVHMRDLGQADKETWESGSRAARAGGVTLVFDMPNSIPPTTNSAGLEAKRAVAAATFVGKRFFIGAAPGRLSSVEQVLAGHPDDVVGIKLYMAGSSSNEVVSDYGEIREYLALAAAYRTTVAVHAEEQAIVASATEIEASAATTDARRSSGLVPSDHGSCRPREAAIRATERVIQAARDTGATLYLCHVSTGEEFDLIREAKRSQEVYCEVTPHHLFLDETALATWGNVAKVNPPLRTHADREKALEAIADGTVDTMGSDHAPHLVAEKSRPYIEAPSGFPGLETSMGVIMTLYSDGAFGLERLVDLTSRNTAKIFELGGYGEIAVGTPGDLTLVDPELEWHVDPRRFESKAHYSPFEGTKLRGRAIESIVGGHAWSRTKRGDQ